MIPRAYHSAMQQVRLQQTILASTSFFMLTDEATIKKWLSKQKP